MRGRWVGESSHHVIRWSIGRDDREVSGGSRGYLPVDSLSFSDGPYSGESYGRFHQYVTGVPPSRDRGS